MRLSVWSGVAFLVLLGIGMAALAQLVPPPKASETAREVADFYRDDTDRLRAGLMVMMVGSAFFVPWAAAIGDRIKRIEGGSSTPMAHTQIVSGAVVAIGIIIPSMLMVGASFRPERDPVVTQALHDLAWIVLLGVFSPFVVQCLSVAVPIFGHAEQKIYPRWVAYFNVWIALLAVPAGLLPFFKTGAFAWHGLFPFWVGASIFFIWVIVMTVVTLRSIDQQQP